MSTRRKLLAGAGGILLAASAVTLSLSRCDQNGDAPGGTPADLAEPGGPPMLDGTWYLNAGGERLTLRIERAPDGGATGDAAGPETPGSFTGTLEDGLGPAFRAEGISWDATTGELALRATRAGETRRYEGRVVEGIIVGRFALAAGAFTGRFTGWRAPDFDRDLAPRVFDLLVGDEYMATLRIDRPATAARTRFTGRFKIYASKRLGAGSEQKEYDVRVTAWDGAQLAFELRDPGYTQTYAATVTGRTLSGTFSTLRSGKEEPEQPFRGTRAEILSHGFEPRAAAWLGRWREVTRRRIAHLMMAGNPAPTGVATEVGDPASPSEDAPYSLSEITLRARLAADPTGSPTPANGEVERRIHGFIARPATAPSPGAPGGAPGKRLPAILALNGHDGSARGMFDPKNALYGFGDRYAREGYVVLAIDVGHRPLADREDLYKNYTDGDDPDRGNGLHPAIRTGPGPDTAWEEEGERVWDAQRALDHLLSLPEVDPARIVLTGLSMGSEVASYVAALDERVSILVTAGFSPDLGVMLHHNNHPCWRFRHADLREYFEVSDLHALVAPRPLVAQTGQVDPIYSNLPTPYSGDKQVLRRSRAAYRDHPARIVHYLHPDNHRYRFGDPGGVLALTRIAPDGEDDLAWQLDPTTRSLDQNLFQLIDYLLADAGRADTGAPPLRDTTR